MRRTRRIAISIGLVVGAGTAAAQLSTPTCPQTSTPTAWTPALLDTTTTKSGAVFDGSNSYLELPFLGATFSNTNVSSVASVVFAAVGDFNKDGWQDFVGAPASTASAFLFVYMNETWISQHCNTPACTAYDNPAGVWPTGGSPPWGSAAFVMPPNLALRRNLHCSDFTNINPTCAGGPGSFNFNGANSGNGRYSLAAGDFNGDGWDDVFETFAPSGNNYEKVKLYLNSASNDGSNNPTFAASYDALGFAVTTLEFQGQFGTSIQAADYNLDGHLDILISQGDDAIRILLGSCTEENPIVTQPATRAAPVGLKKCATNPTFADGSYLIFDLDVINSVQLPSSEFNSSSSLPVFRYEDFDADGLRDLLVSSVDCCNTAAYRLRLFKGCSPASTSTCSASKLELTASQYLPGVDASTPFPGGAAAILADDFNLDGKLDVIVGTDNNQFPHSGGGVGGQSFFWANTGTGTPFSNYAVVTQTRGTGSGQSLDFDVGFSFDYDHDPLLTPDFVMADGNSSGAYYLLANRASANIAGCGELSSGIIDLGALSDDELVVTAGKLTVSHCTPSGGTITYYMSNSEPADWQPASLCPGFSATAGCGTVDYCVTFPRAVGRDVRWRAVLDSNDADSNTCTTGAGMPTISSVSATFDYTSAIEHYRAGVIVNDGVAYVGAFHQPGDRGRFYAVNAGLTTVYWNAGDKLDNNMTDGERNIYTSLAALPVRYDFTVGNASDPLFQGILGAPDVTSATNVVNWVRSKRFGLGTDGFPLTKLGAVETSTPAVLTKPGRPSYYSFATTLDRQRIDAFVAASATRVPLALFGSKDGMVHAIHTRPADISNPINGKEAWAYVPPSTASNLLNDLTLTQAANAAETNGQNHTVITSYPDGSPTLVDYHAGGGVYKTVAIVAEGNGGRGFIVFDVTQTVDPSTDAVLGPTPMWSGAPGDGDAGHSFAKPAVARVLINNNERFIVIAGTGPDYANPNAGKGRIVSAYDLVTGTMLWKFQTACAVTSDITAFETDDLAEPDKPTLNGFIDRAVFGDDCGFIYKIAPGQDKAGGWLPNANLGTITANTAPDGTPQLAVFSTETSPGAIGGKRPIAGTIAARTDNSTRMILFFGTGGIETAATTLQNAFFALYADDGTVRSKFDGACNAGVCEKFYGGTVVTPEQVIFTRTFDPVVGSSTCDPGSSKIQAVQLNDDSSNNFVTDFTLAVSSAVMGSLFGDAGAIYFATLSGSIGRIGAPRAPNAGDDTAAGYVGGMGPGDPGSVGQTVGTSSPFSLMGWRVIL